MSLQRAWMLLVGLLLVVGMVGCGEEPEPFEKPEPEVGREEAIAAISRLGGCYGCDVNWQAMTCRATSSGCQKCFSR